MAAEESSTPKHGRHSAVGRHAAPSPAESEPGLREPAEASEPPVSEGLADVSAPGEAPHVPAAPDVPVSQQAPLPDLVPVMDGDQETSMGAAPRPIDIDPQETGSFRCLDANEGARLTTRANASEAASSRAQSVRPVEAVRMSTAGRPKVAHREVEVKSNRRVFLILGLGALMVVVIVASLLNRAFSSVEQAGEKPIVEQVQAGVGEEIEYRGVTYSLKEQAGGTYALVSTAEESESELVLAELSGTPVGLILYNTVFVMPENLPDDSWDLIAHPMGGGSVTQQVTDADGAPLIGEGQIASATLEGDSIIIATDSGEQYSVSLV